MASRLYSRTVRRAALTPAQREEMFALMDVCYAGLDQTQFRRDLEEKDLVILMFPKGTSRVVGFSTVRLAKETLAGRPVEIVYSGDTVIHPDYWGDGALDSAFTRVLIRRKLANPTRAVFWLLLSAGYKTYFKIIKYFPLAFPQRGVAPSEAHLSFLRSLASRWFGARFDAQAGVVRVPGTYHVRPTVVPIDEQARSHPDIAFYLEKNPGHVNGDELVCLAEVRTRDLLVAAVRVVRKRRGRLPRPGATGPAIAAPAAAQQEPKRVDRAAS